MENEWELRTGLAIQCFFAQALSNRTGAKQVPPLENASGKKTGLRTVARQTWEEMLDIVKCKVLSVVEGVDMDAYLLR